MKTLSKHGPAVLLLLAMLIAAPSRIIAQQTRGTKHVLVLHWDQKDHPANIEFDRNFEANLEFVAPGEIEIYPEFLDSNRFPGENQFLLLRNYLRQKYADRPIDVVVANSKVPLDFLLKNRANLFPDTPIVFTATGHPSAADLAAGAGATGLVFVNSHRRTVEMALRLHPGTKHLFVVCGTIEGDPSFETEARNQLRDKESTLAITYLTDLPLERLKARLMGLPAHSIVLYVWQQERDRAGKVVESRDFLASIAHRFGRRYTACRLRTSALESLGAMSGPTKVRRRN
jgi:hypothetical protein